MEQVAVLLSYLIGSIPSGYLLVRWTTGRDVRASGSGNIGATNVLRAAGPAAGIGILIFDMLKGLVSTRLIPARLIGPSVTPAIVMACGTAAVLGHVFPVFLKFKGGKGVATVLGALAGAHATVALITVGVWAAVFAATRYVSAGSLAAAASIPVSMALLHRTSGEIALAALLAAVIIARHKDNIRRLAGGSEHRAWSGKSKA